MRKLGFLANLWLIFAVSKAIGSITGRAIMMQAEI
jgi:hypothetical protein